MKRSRAVIVAGGFLLLAAFVFDAAPLFVPGIGFLLVGVFAPAWVWLALRRAEVRRRFSEHEVVEHQPVEAVLSVKRGVLGLPGAEIHDPLSPDPVRLLAPMSLLVRRRAEIRLVARFERRGMQRLEAPLLALSDPLGLARLVRRGAGRPQELLVLPRTEPVAWRTEAGARLTGAEAGVSEESLAAVDIDGLRPYREGTPASRIHWPALAKGQGLLERQLRAEGEARALVVLDVRHGEDGPMLDAAVRATASLVLELAREGSVRVLLPGDTRAATIDPDLRGWPALHTRLAVLTASQATVPPLTGIAAGGQVFYVALRFTRRLPGLGPGGGLRAIVLPRGMMPAGGAAPVFSVSGCDGFVLGGSVRPARRRRAARAARS